ncbi:proepiregulin [Elgaria multicarinata webbii]|uniref:proepiregulin n=1 Tax=Elgaria multicarinata webbii TaxID=159646 RepID=UPI002FCD4A90
MASGSAQQTERVFLLLSNIQEAPPAQCLCINLAHSFSAGLHLFQAVLGTTVTPLCGPNETESCTTALVRTENTPRAAHVLFKSCKADMRNYCMNGECRYILDLNKHSCKCHMGYFGSRCELSNLEVIQLPLSKEYLALTILMVLIFFMAISVAIYFYYRWYENKRRKLAARRNYEEVATDTEKDPALLHV